MLKRSLKKQLSSSSQSITDAQAHSPCGPAVVPHVVKASITCRKGGGWKVGCWFSGDIVCVVHTREEGSDGCVCMGRSRAHDPSACVLACPGADCPDGSSEQHAVLGRCDGGGHGSNRAAGSCPSLAKTAQMIEVRDGVCWLPQPSALHTHHPHHAAMLRSTHTHTGMQIDGQAACPTWAQLL